MARQHSTSAHTPIPSSSSTSSACTLVDATALKKPGSSTPQPQLSRPPPISANDDDTSTINTTPSTQRKKTPLPLFQVIIVSSIMIAEPLTASVIYPFVNQFVQETGIANGDEKKTGYYAGIIESLFFIGEAFTVFYWGWASDRVGRRPILLLGPLGLAFATLGFGFTKSFWPLVFYRGMQGVFNGNIGVSKSVLAELSDETNMADAFSLLPLVWSFGITVGPIIGGILARPAAQWPDTWGKIKLMKDYPYLLACGVAAAMAFISYLLALIGLKETLPSLVAKEKEKLERDTESTRLLEENASDYGSVYKTTNTSHAEDASSLITDTTVDEDEKPLPFRALMIPRVLIPLTNYLFFAFGDMSASALRPLMYSTSIHHGGLNFTPYQIGVIMGIWGAFNAIIQVFWAARIINHYGPKRIFILAQFSLVGSLAVFPVLRWFAQAAGRVDGWVWAAIVVQLVFMTMTYIAYGCIHLFIAYSAPNRASLGSTNGLAQMLTSMIRSLAPTIASSLFSVSLERQLAGGLMVYWVLIGIALAGVRTSFLLPSQLHGTKR